MASPVKPPVKTAKKELRPRSPLDKKRGKLLEESSSTLCEEQSSTSTLKGEDIQALAIRPEHLEKLRAPQPPKDSQKPRATTHVFVRKTRPHSEVRKGVTVTVARPLPQDAAPQPLDYTGPGGPRFDAEGMVLPHSILGSLEDFRREMEVRGEMELVKRIPDQKTHSSLETGGQRKDEKTKSVPKSGWDLQGNALKHWNYHMAERRRQQDFISQLLQKPVEDLLMTQSSAFRQIQEQRDIISRGLPTLHPGHGHRVGSEFWSVPQRFGDELSGITVTLTQTERGKPQPITHVSQPRSTRLESGNVQSDRSISRAWSQSEHLQYRQHELRDILREMDYNQPDMDGLEVVGSCRPLTSVSVERSTLLDDKEQEEEEEESMASEYKENEDPLACYDDVMLDVELIPALRICGELARWNGSATSHQGEVGMSARLSFEAVVGKSACSHLELKNEGSTAIYYSWQRLERPHSFTEAMSHPYTQHFYFNTSTAVILPGDTERILFTFKSVYPGIVSEVWQVHTHPVLLGGASLQVTMRGVALHHDKLAEQRAALELELEQRATVSLCRSVVYEILRNVHTPERPGSPAHLYTTEEEHFYNNNPNLHYHHEPVEALKRLWEQTQKSQISGSEDEVALLDYPAWDLSMDHLRQAVLALPQEDTDSETDVLSREEALRQYNILIHQLHQQQSPSPPLTLQCIGLQLWRELCDELASKALWLRHTLGLPENDNWGDTPQEQNSWGALKMDKALSKEEKKGGNTKEKEEKKGVPKPAVKDKPAEDRGPVDKKKTKEEKKGKKDSKVMRSETSSTATSPENDNITLDNTHLQLQPRYTHTLHQQVYILLERMIDSLCDLLEEAQQHEDYQCEFC
ncbi:MYCBP-associated protein [Hoplias malabaricus]|uniref:MYCBP-associated protein n=1 Tax=Hoplias malabaricus TaxID=27720 RepID=UPI0034632DA8